MKTGRGEDDGPPLFSYDALPLLSGMIEGVRRILVFSVRFFPSADGFP